jgi:tetratricopeptide (TPR) repeat protein
MDVGRWKQIDDLFDEALHLPPDDRPDYLNRACTDPDVRQEVESLLAAYVPQGDPIQEAFDRALASLPATDREEQNLEGARIGRYTLLRLIGKGGMGDVYSAWRADDFQMLVALKLLKPGAATAAALRRFRAERQILAGLEHPNIARLLDGGASDHGLPYLVMEFVDGTPLLEHAGPLPLRERLRLFRDICSAAHYAHERHVVHRDIKPANILVTREGVPKLLDFGIAKILSMGAEPSETGLTTGGMAPMTPDYASPEQVRGEAVTPAADVYQLGAVLYELLTGLRAHRTGSLSPAEMQQEVCTTEPPRPSAVVQGLDSDLDKIVMKALWKEPVGRYPSAQEFAEDIDRFLDGRPVRARTPGVLYRGRRFVTRHRISVIAALASATAVALLGGTVLYFAAHRAPLMTERDTLVIAGISNRTGDPVFDDALRQALFVKLSESPWINALTDDQINRTLRLMGRRLNEPLTPELGREICLRSGSGAVISGSLSRVEDEYVLTLEARNCSTGELLAGSGEQVEGKRKVLAGLGRAATQLRRKLGESLSSVRRFDKPLEATTSSLEALQAYSLARKARQEGRQSDQLALLRRATELDPGFAYAWAGLSAEYSNLRDTEKAYEYGRRAFELRDRVTEREKFLLLDRYYNAVTGQLEERIQSARVWSLTYPRDHLAYAGLSSAYGLAGRLEDALAATLEVLRRDPGGVTAAWVNAIGYYTALGRLDEAKQVYQEARRRNLRYSHLPLYYYVVAFLRGDEAAMAEAVQQAMSSDGGDYEMLVQQAFTAAFQGRIGHARELTQLAIERAQSKSDTSRIALGHGVRAHMEALFGMKDAARSDAAAAVGLTADRTVLVLAASSLARCGAAAPALTTAGTLAKKYPLNTTINRIYLPVIRAEIENAARRPAAGMEALQAAAPYDFATNGLTLTMYPAYVRGEAALYSGNAQAAAAEFRKILDRPGLTGNSPIFPLARLGSARARSALGDRQGSCADYEALLHVWKDADTKSPVVVQARKEFASRCRTSSEPRRVASR